MNLQLMLKFDIRVTVSCGDKLIVSCVLLTDAGKCLAIILMCFRDEAS
jgi:hypothetical protein